MSETQARDIVYRSLDAVSELCGRYQIGALEDFLESCRSFAEEKLLNVAVLGRFKAGKSTLLNHLLGRPLLPVGVVPVTTVVTEIQEGPRERAEVHFIDGHVEDVPVDQIAEFIAETQNPENAKQVTLVRVELPSMQRYRGIRFVDTPGLESVLEHNTDAAMDWLPNVGLALVAVGVDPPLSQHDVDLIRNLNRYTPNVSLLLTKVDVLDEREQAQVQEFVRKQLGRYWNGSVPIFPYSAKAGFERLRAQLHDRLFSQVSAEAGVHRTQILCHKVASLLAECTDYLNVALKSAEVADSERAQLREKVLGEKAGLEDTRLAVRLAVRHAAGATRSRFEEILRNDEAPVRQRLLTALDRDFAAWSRSLSIALELFESWLLAATTLEMSEISGRHREEFVAPVHHVGRQLSQSLQDFRNRLSERTLEALGVPLRTTQIDLSAQDPRSPDVRVGKIFDRNWELLSFLIPMTIFKRSVRKHFERKVADTVFMDLSRLASQWEEIVNGSLHALEKEALRRLDSLIGTIERMITSAQAAPRIREDLQNLEALRIEIEHDRNQVPS